MSNKKLNLHKFAPAYELGPAEDYPAGSIEWAERISQALQLGAKSITKHTVHHLWDIIKAILTAEPRPWEIWPQNNPFKTPDDYCLAVTGHSWEFLCSMVAEFADGDNSINIGKMRTELAKAQAEHRPQGAHHAHSKMKVGSTQRAYLLRRLARDHPLTLDAYEGGEYPSVRAAAIAAGIITPQTPLDRLRKAWKAASPEEREKFRAEIDGVEE